MQTLQYYTNVTMIICYGTILLLNVWKTSGEVIWIVTDDPVFVKYN